MQRVAIRLYGSGTWTTFPINPLEFENLDNLEFNQMFTVDGRSIEQYPQFDGRVRTMTWKNLPNRSPYQSFVNTMKGWPRRGTYELKLGDLSGTEGDATVQYIKVVSVHTEWNPGAGPASADSNLKWGTIQLRYTFTRPPTT